MVVLPQRMLFVGQLRPGSMSLHRGSSIVYPETR